MLYIVGAALCALAAAEPPSVSTQAAADVNQSLESPAAAQIRLDSMFDGKQPLGGWDPLANVGVEADFRNGQFHKLTLTLPTGLRIEGGQLAIVPPNSLVATSPYFSLRQDAQTRGGFLDGDLKLQAGIAYLGARLFTDPNPSADSQINSAIGSVDGAANYFGLTPTKIGQIGSQLSGQSTFYPPPIVLSQWLNQQLSVNYNNQWQPIFVASALGQAGKTFQLVGPFDLGLVTGALLRWESYFPNAVLDQTAALRAHAGPFNSAVLFGVSEGLSIMGPTFWSDSISSGSFSSSVRPDFAPHVGTELWGSLPIAGDTRYDVGGSAQFNPMTTRKEVHAGLNFPSKTLSVTVAGRYEDESGPAIEYDRQRGGGDVGVRPFGLPFEFFGGVSHENFQYGNAGLTNDSFLIGIRGGDLSPQHPKTVSVSQQFGGVDQMKLPPQEQLLILEQIHHYAEVVNGLWQAHQGQVYNAWGDVQSAWNKLPPWLQQLANQEAHKANPNLPPLSQIFGFNLKSVPIGTITQLADTLTDPSVFEEVLLRLAQHQILEYLQNVKVPVYGHIDFTAPVILAAANVYSIGFSPVPPITAGNARNDISGYLLQELESAGGGPCNGQTTSAAYTNCLLGQLPSSVSAQAQKEFGPALSAYLQQSIQWASDTIRLQMNQEMLEVLSASQVLDEMTVDQGVKISDLDTQWLRSAFDRQGLKKDARLSQAIQSAKRDLQTQVNKQVEDLKVKLSLFGEQRRNDLQALAKRLGVDFDVPAGDWPALLSFYGDERLTAFMGRAIGRMGAGTKLRIEFSRMAGVGVMIVKQKDGLTIKLPPVQDGATPEHLLDMASESLPLGVTSVPPPNPWVGLGPW